MGDAVAEVGGVDDGDAMGRAFHDEAENEKDLEQINVDENGRFIETDDGRQPRGEKKRKATQLERLGEALVKLKPGQLARVPLPDDLRAAVVEAQRIWAIKAFGGYRRQVQLIGKIMRTVDAVPINDALEALSKEGTMASLAFQKAEHWRTRLLADGDAAIAGLVADEQGKGVDRTALRQLVRAAQHEVEKQKTTADTPSTNQKKLFRLLRELFEPPLSASSSSSPSSSSSSSPSLGDGPALASDDDTHESPDHE